MPTFEKEGDQPAKLLSIYKNNNNNNNKKKNRKTCSIPVADAFIITLYGKLMLNK
jgi:hypothetical protein